MSAPNPSLPARMRDYEVHAELRETPDLQRLAQLFIGMALARTEQTRTGREGSGGAAGSRQPGEIESEM
ncbi:hypothetical protein [Jonesia quinghaiensis]|uniref:hypothetical protein n=1 Tax=Jonesia quinghaiensis TaxID=262806 RepID=UPI00040884E4|nr:hypothetical protein [Jonesia quinghaiensis]